MLAAANVCRLVGSSEENGVKRDCCTTTVVAWHFVWSEFMGGYNTPDTVLKDRRRK